MRQFRSTNAYFAPLASLVGKEAAERHIANWLSDQLAFVADEDFPHRFQAHFDKFDASPAEYMNRIIRVGGCDVLAGIRFYGGDSSSAFVDVLAWDEGLDFDALRRRAKVAWRSFRPHSVRILTKSGSGITGGYRDQSIHAQRVGEMPRPDGHVTLRPVTDPSDAIRMIEEKYAQIAREDPVLSREIWPAGPEELEECQQQGTLDFIVTDGKNAGLIATAPRNVEFIPGYEIVEELIMPGFNGRGLAAEAQRVLANRLRNEDPNVVIIGTIQRENHASKRSAERAGRPAVFEYVFLAL